MDKIKFAALQPVFFALALLVGLSPCVFCVSAMASEKASQESHSCCPNQNTEKSSEPACCDQWECEKRSEEIELNLFQEELTSFDSPVVASSAPFRLVSVVDLVVIPRVAAPNLVTSSDCLSIKYCRFLI